MASAGALHVMGKAVFLGAIAGAITGVFGIVAGAIIFGSVLGAAVGWWYRTVVKPTTDTVRRVHATYEFAEGLQSVPDLIGALQELPEFMRTVRDDLHALQSAAAATHEPVEALARELDVQHRATDRARPPAA